MRSLILLTFPCIISHKLSMRSLLLVTCHYISLRFFTYIPLQKPDKNQGKPKKSSTSLMPSYNFVHIPLCKALLKKQGTPRKSRRALVLIMRTILTIVMAPSKLVFLEFGIWASWVLTRGFNNSKKGLRLYSCCCQAGCQGTILVDHWGEG